MQKYQEIRFSDIEYHIFLTKEVSLADLHYDTSECPDSVDGVYLKL